MTTVKSTSFTLLLSSLPLLLSAAEKSVIELDGVIVTADQVTADQDWSTREAQFFKPYSKETIDQTKITEEGIKNVTDAISDISGVTINSQGAFQKSITIRGLDGPRVSTIVDGVKVGNQGISHTGAGEINMTDLGAVSSINVIKGSPSVVFDPGASGGIVEINTLTAPTEKGFHGKQKFAYDQGYNQQKSTTTLSAGTGKIGALIVYTKDDADDYKVAGQSRETELLVNQFQLNQQLSLEPKTLNDLGYEAESVTFRGRADLGNQSYFDIGIDRWKGEDIVSIHGDTVDNTASVIQYDLMERDKDTISYRRANVYGLEDFSLNYSNQRIHQVGTSATTLESETVTIGATLPLNKTKFSFGAEITQDKAETLVYSEQDYIGAFGHLEYDLPRWTLSAGVRANQWTTRQKLLDGSNAVVAEQLLGISGVTPEKTVSEPTWSFGAIYKLNKQQNLAFNLSSTYRAPDLYERYAFGSGFVGGGINMLPESGKHAEFSWKFLDDHLSISATAFYSEFDNFINTRTIRQITDNQGLQDCILINQCDPVNGDFNDRESDFFTQYVKYYNADAVDNVGAEVSARLDKEQYTATVGLSYNDFRSADLYVLSHARPLKLTASYKYNFNQKWNPWVKVKGEYTSDYPNVVQTGGFSPFFKADLYAGLKIGDTTINAGINNVFNETYREPYNGINALERSFFTNMSYEW